MDLLLAGVLSHWTHRASSF